ncbi:hypothetical protein AAG906_025465 [Vitis piasezkii]
MAQPHGFVDPQFPSYVCIFNKALYGLKQAPRAWFHKLSHALIQWGFQASRADSSMFLRHSATDVLIFNSSQVSYFISYLNSTFAIRDLGRLNYFLAIEAPSVMVCSCTKLTPLIFKGIQMQIGPLAQMTIGVIGELCLSPSVASLVWCDNQSAAHLAANPVFHSRSKYIELDLHFIRDHVLRKNLSIHYIPTCDQIADIFTKHLPSSKYLGFRTKLSIVPCPVSLRGDDSQIEYTQASALPNQIDQELSSR